MELLYPTYVKNNPHIRITTKKYELPAADRNDAKDIKTTPLAETFLYLPSNLADAVGSSWSSETMTETVQAAAANVARLDRSKAGIKDYIKAVGGAVSFESVKRDTLEGISKKVGGESIKRQVTALTGTMMKPNDVLVLDQIGRYSMNLTWDFYPQNSEEGEMVRKILKNFKKWVQPTLSPAGGVLGMDYPPIFDIYVKVSSASVNKVTSADIKKSLFFYTNMVLENVSISYSGGQNEALFYSDGTPTVSNMNLTFKSLRPGYLRGSEQDTTGA